MQIGRRAALKLFALVGLGLSGIVALWRRLAVAQSPALELRKIGADDAADLQAIMNSCVVDADAFHGKCDPWSLSWADHMVRRRKESVILTVDGIPAAFFELAPIGRFPDPPEEDASAEEWGKYELRDRNCRTFRLSAAGVRADVLSAEEAVEMFRRLLYYGAKAARDLGYDYLECLAPWDQHPKMPRKFTDYPGCELTQPVSYSQAGGRDLYWLRWNLDDMITALAEEGAGEEQLDVL
jgi:hypothetical protein